MRSDGTARRHAVGRGHQFRPRSKSAWGPITLSSDPQNLTLIGSKLYFSADSGVTNGNTGRELWVTDLSVGGVTLVSNIRSGTQGSDPENLTNVNGVLYFSANDGNGFEPFRSEGTDATTTQVANINGGNSSSNPHGFMQAGSLVYFAAFESNSGVELVCDRRNSSWHLSRQRLAAGRTVEQPDASGCDQR